MTAPLINWLKETFTSLDEVRFSTNRPDPSLIFQSHTPDLVVHTWMGARLNIYLIDKKPRSRDLNNILKNNSRNGIGTLFIVNTSLLPEHGTTISTEGWLLALRSLSEDFLYVYRPDNPTALFRLQITEASLEGQHSYWYHSDFEIESVSVRLRKIKGTLKGDWHVGDLVSPAFRRNARARDAQRANQRFHYSTKQTKEVFTAPVDELWQHYEFLGIERDASKKDVKAAYRKMAMKLHPDVSEYPEEEAQALFVQLNKAYDFIMKFRDWQ